MFKLLIADDEAGSREWLSQEIAWEDHDICLVGPAVDGAEAWRLFQEESPEIVLTDIRMPGMDGIELARAMLSLNPGTRILVISGHDEFSYAKACLEIGVSGYILKPTPPEEILQAVLKERALLLSRQADETVWNSFRTQLQSSIPYLREQFLRDLFRGDIEDGDLSERLRFLQVPTEVDRPVVALIVEIKDEVEFHLHHDEKECQLIRLAMYDLAQAVLSENGCAARLEHGGVGALFFGGPEGKIGLAGQAARAARQLLDQARVNLPCALAIGIGDVMEGIASCHRSFTQAKQALSIQTQFKVESLADHAHFSHLEHQLPYLSVAEEERLGVRLETGNSVAEAVHALVQSLLGTVTGSVRADFLSDWRRETGWVLTGMLVRLAQRNGLTIRQFIPSDDYAVLLHGGPEGGPDDLARWWETQFGRLGHALTKIQSNGLRGCIKKAVDYIEVNLADSISLSRVAREVYMSPSYLSRLFREQMGESFSVYVTRRKMEEARRLLGMGEKKVYEVAAAVGYTDPAYFGRVFRQFFAATPTEYKEGKREA